LLDVFELILEHASQSRPLVTLNTRFVQQANNILSQYRRPIPHLHTVDITSFSIGVATEQGMDELAGFCSEFSYLPTTALFSYFRPS
jgi:hypothetical protein